MFRHYLIGAFRHLWRFKSSSAMSVLGLALGLACFIVAFGSVTYLTRGDREFASIDRTFLISSRFFLMSDVNGYDTGFTGQGPGAAAKYLPAESPELAAVASLSPLPGMRIYVGGRLSFIDAAWADPTFLRIFPLPVVRSAAVNPLSGSRQVMLSEDAAVRLFGTPVAVGRTLNLENALDVTVGAVMKPFPPTSHFFRTSEVGPDDFGFDLLVSRDTFESLQRALHKPPPDGGLHTYVMLPEGGRFTARDLDERLQGFGRRHGFDSPIQHVELRAVPVSQLRLDVLQRSIFPLQAGLSLVALVMSVAALVLGIACVNCVNIAVAQSLARAREIGIRCVLGAGRLHVAAQHLTESTLQTGLAAGISVAILAGVARVLDARAGLDLLGTIGSSTQFWVGVALILVAVAALSGVYPAIGIAGFRPVSAIRAGATLAPSRAGSRLIVLAQFSMASLLLVTLAVVFSQNARLREIGLPAGTDQTIVLGRGWSADGATFEAWREALMADPAVRSVAAINHMPWSDSIQVPIFVASHPRSSHLLVLPVLVSQDFRDALGARLLAGHAFDRADAGQATDGIVIDRALSQALGFGAPQAAVDRIVYELDPGDLHLIGGVKIAGVIENEPLRIMAVSCCGGRVHMSLYQLMRQAQSGGATLVVGISKGAVPQALATIDRTWRRLSSAPLDRHFLDELFERAYRIHADLGRVLAALTGVGCAIAMMGVFGTALFVAERRAHEIGVRKAIGARSLQIIVMMLREFSKPVLVANLLSWPIAYLATEAYLSFFTERIGLTPLPFAFGLAVTLAAAWVAAYGQAHRASRVEPAAALRYP